MALSSSELADAISERFGLDHADAHWLLLFGGYRQMEGDVPPTKDDPTPEDVRTWSDQVEAVRTANHWTAAGIARNVKHVLSQKGRFKPNETAMLKATAAKVPDWDKSGVLQRVADFVAGVYAAGAGAILSGAPSSVIANLLCALDPAILGKETLERLESDLDETPIPVPQRLQEAFDALVPPDFSEMEEEEDDATPLIVAQSSRMRH
jgi:hypothetical protein